ncbi:CocE/NonD family hydrolase [Solirubrobacter soli]|uniref:CocE/NonD family hydrolase n=1 Tax=Solirubrobacter soli TaxID=363832 RepID=UPI000417953E|nr:CocE/NonD family hydrolase [Solirubrobacter soli]
MAAGALALAALAMGGGGVAQAQTGPVLENGKTKAVYDYRAAIRERVFIPQPGIDADRSGADDWITIDIIRPSEGSSTNKMPAIIDPSPYYTTSCRGNETQCMADWDNDGVNDRWPLFYDNYFLPRGYAYILAQMNGTAYTQHGCPMHGGPTDIAGEKSVVDWLNGRVKGYKSASLTATEVVADWHNGSSAMIGKSYDGTLANGVASTGVDGLKTIVPISAISAWYNYSRTGGVRHNTNYPGGSLNPGITNRTPNRPGVNLPNRLPICTPINNDINNDANTDTGDGDTHGDINTFWRDRDYNKDVSKVKAAVFAIHGFQDDNVRMDHMGLWWEGLKANNVPRKLWLLRTGHTDPFEQRRAEWVTTLHRWFDYWLYNVPNGIMSEPQVTVEDEKDVWKEYASWPIPNTQNVDLYLRASTDTVGTVGAFAGGGVADTQGFTANGASENTLTNLTSQVANQGNKRVYMTAPLTKDVRLSGTAQADLAAALGADQSNLSVIIADQSDTPFNQVTRSGDGIVTGNNRTCWGATGAGGPECTIGAACEASAQEIDTACYAEVTKPEITIPSDQTGTNNDQMMWRVTRGIRDSSNRSSLWFQDATTVTPGVVNRYRFPTMPTEHIFKAGHRIAIIVAGTNTSMASATGNQNVAVSLDTRTTKVTLPVVGGYEALAAAGAFTDPTAPVGGTVPATLSLTLGASASFGAFTPGLAKEYTASTTATVISSAADATLTVADPSSVATGRLVNGTFALPQPLQGLGVVKTWNAPTSNEVVPVTFKQAIGANDALRTGAYSKTLTFTLSTTTP